MQSTHSGNMAVVAFINCEEVMAGARVGPLDAGKIAEVVLLFA